MNCFLFLTYKMSSPDRTGRVVGITFLLIHFNTELLDHHKENSIWNLQLIYALCNFLFSAFTPQVAFHFQKMRALLLTLSYRMFLLFFVLK